MKGSLFSRAMELDEGSMRNIIAFVFGAAESDIESGGTTGLTILNKIKTEVERKK